MTIPEGCRYGEHPSPSWPVYDARSIYLCRVCEHCEAEKLSEFRPEILTGYDESDVDEPIDPDGPEFDEDSIPY